MTSAPTTSPSRYTEATAPTAPLDRCSVASLVRVGITVAAMVISSPSRIQAIPSAATMRVKNGDQGSRSMRAGIRDRIVEFLRA